MANSEDRAARPGDAKPPRVETPAPRVRLRKFAPLLVFPALFAAALAGSWQLRAHFMDNDEIAPTPAEPSTSRKKTEPPGNPAELLERGDQALALHRFARALAHYEELLEHHPEHAPLVAYRIGLCYESLGQLDKAQAAYRKALDGASTLALTLAGHLGTARCLLRDHQPATARRILNPFLLDEARQQNVPAPLLAGMRYLIALAFAEETLHPPMPRPADDGFVSFNIAALEIPFYLDEISTPARPRDGKVVEPMPSPLSVKKQANALETVVTCVEQNDQSACKLLEMLATEAGLAGAWTPEARQQLEGRTLRVALRNWPLVELLEQAADRFGLVCHLDGNTVRFSTAAQTDPKVLSLAARGATRRALLAALRTDATHPWTPAAQLELGIGEAGDGNTARAAIWFERVVRNAPASGQAGPACYNLALLHARNQEYALARQAWFRVIDHVPGHELALRAHLRIAQTHLEEENAREAIIVLRRALPLAPGSRYQPVAALFLGAAYLQNDEPENARAVLTSNRKALLTETHKAMAMFLNAYAEYRLARSGNGGRREASELLNSLWQGMDDNPLGPIGHGLIARAYYDLGFHDQAEQRLRQALADTRGPYVTPLEYLLGETMLKQDRRADAVALFTKLAAKRSPYHSRAIFQLAQVDLQEKRFSECAEKCRQLWSEETFTPRAALLQLWGGALEGTGEFRKAARCFAGKAPD